MIDRDTLLRACLDNPAEDTPRLVLADWFQENDHPYKAAILRKPGFWRSLGGLLSWVELEHIGAKWAIGLWPYTHPHHPVCTDCQSHGTVDLRPDPYKLEINDEEVYDWRCAECRQNKLDDI